MQMFEVKYDECQATGIASFEMDYDIGSGLKHDRGSYLDRRDAEKYVDSSKRHYILIIYEKYINHVRALMEAGHHDFYQTPAKMEAFEKCQKYNHWFQDKPLEMICKVILAIQEDLRKILPSSQNQFREALESSIIDMVIFCRKEYKQPVNAKA